MLIVEPSIVEHVSEIQSVMKINSSMEPPQTAIENEIWQLKSNLIINGEPQQGVCTVCVH